jgi:two-component system sensor histidine kinase YesM
MGFQKKLLLTYSLLVLLLVSVLAVLFYQYASGLFEQNALDNYGLITTKLSDQLDNVFRPMDFISTNLISDASFKSALSSLDTLDRGNPHNTFFLTEAQRTIQSQLYTYSIVKNFYALVVFNRRNDFFTSNLLQHNRTTDAGNAYQRLAWIPSADAAMGSSITITPYSDIWDPKTETNVFGRGRMVRSPSEGVGYIAVLKKVEELNPIFTVSDPRFAHTLAFLPTGEILYKDGNVSPALETYYQRTAEQMVSPNSPDSPRFTLNQTTGNREALLAYKSEYTGITVALVLDRRILLAPLNFLRNLTLGIGILIILVSIAYTWISSTLLTQPLRIIQAKMEATQLSNLTGGQPLQHPIDEITALDRSFMSLKERLDQSIQRELDSRTLWMRARFDSLQAQVNPHFINNILTVIAGRGLELGDEVIGEICDGVASMLRYSTSTTEEFATVGEELAHLGNYLFLMKQRLEDRLTYSIEVDPAIRGARIPKIVFQQIAENSLTHGYKNKGGPIKLTVRGALVPEGRWLVELTDNGEGIEDATLEKLNKNLRTLRDDPRNSVLEWGLKIGGLGLINLYARLYLFYDGDVDWGIENRAEGGVRVTLGGPLRFLEDPKVHV